VGRLEAVPGFGAQRCDKKARFNSPDALYPKVQQAIQKATARVASGESSPDDAAKRFTDDLKQALGADKVAS